MDNGNKDKPIILTMSANSDKKFSTMQYCPVNSLVNRAIYQT